MQTFDHLLNWTLKAGSHAFPGKDGGTCINEAALVAEGFPYKRIRSVEDMPACFSRSICRLAMVLNDNAADAERQRLMPYVMRLACADTPEVERARAAYIKRGMLNPDGLWNDTPLCFDKGLQVLEGALAIGRQADPDAPDAVRSRMEAVRGGAKTPTSVPDRRWFAKMKNWLTMEEPA